MAEAEPKPSDVGFGYISNDPVQQQATLRSDMYAQTGAPLKSALKTPGTPGRHLNPLSPTFREEQMLEKEEGKTEIQQAKDLVSFEIDLSFALTNGLTENQNSSPYGQICLAGCQLLLLTYRPLNAEHNLFDLQCN